LGSFAFLAFSQLFHFFFSLKFPLALYVGCDPSWGFHERKFIQAQNGTARDIVIVECARNNKDDLSLFQAQSIKINKL
jgi:hypothetical protein